jgi:hypothetical protein
MTFDPATMADTWADAFRMLDGETLHGLLGEYEKVASDTDELLVSLPDLDAAQPLDGAKTMG